nr:PREDICTED: uncharacterized protein LOC107126876 [Macaca fascicularis]
MARRGPSQRRHWQWLHSENMQTPATGRVAEKWGALALRRSHCREDGPDTASGTRGRSSPVGCTWVPSGFRRVSAGRLPPDSTNVLLGELFPCKRPAPVSRVVD